MSKRGFSILLQIGLAIFGGLLGFASLFIIAIVVSCLGECSVLEWESVGWFALLLPVLMPLVLVRLVFLSVMRIKFTVFILILAIILNLLLVAMTLQERLHFSKYTHLPQGNDFTIIICLWSVWQVIALVTLIIQVRTQK